MLEWVDIGDEDAFARHVLRASTPVVVAFETDDCDHCRRQRSLLALAWRQLGWTAPTVRVDASRLPQLAERHRIAGYPTIAVFADGRLIERFPGRRDPQTLTRRLIQLLAGHDRRGAEGTAGSVEADAGRRRGGSTSPVSSAAPKRTPDPCPNQARSSCA